MTATGAMADAPAAPAALRPDVDLVSWPSDSDMTVVRVSRQRRQLVSSAGAAVRRLDDGEVCVREPGDGLQDPSLSLVNLATLQQPDGDQSSVRLEPLSSWVSTHTAAPAIDFQCVAPHDALLSRTGRCSSTATSSPAAPRSSTVAPDTLRPGSSPTRP